jgi:hypothetical protein
MTLFASGSSDAAHSRALTAVTDLADGRDPLAFRFGFLDLPKFDTP